VNTSSIKYIFQQKFVLSESECF